MVSSSALYRSKAALRERLAEVPPSSGIYRFYDVTGSVIYVGKSISLRNRVRSYFTGKAAGKKLRRLRQETAALDWEETGSELEALLLESRTVKRLQPRFNVLLRAFVPLPYVRVDLRDPFPRLEVTRAPQRDGATYFGPFRSQGVLESAVAALSDALLLRDCTTPGLRLVGQRPCHRYDFGTCCGPCLGAVSSEEYLRAVESASAVFEGRGPAPLHLLTERMERAAERLQFEIAARFRDVIRHIQALGGRQQALISATRDLSLVAVCPSRRTDTLCLFVLRSGRLVFQEEVPRLELQAPRARRAWAQRLALLEAPPRDPNAVRIDPSVLDEIQIVTAWMKQKTREGAYWEFPQASAKRELVAELDAWLAAQALPETAQLAA